MKLTALGKLLLFLVGLGLFATAAVQLLPPENRSWDGLLAKFRGSREPAAQRGPVATQATAVANAKPILRLHGSNTIGKDLAPALAERFLATLGATGVSRQAVGADAVVVEGLLNGQAAPARIEIEAHGSSTAFENLLSGTTDVGMSSRRVKNDERARLMGLGDMTSSASEHVLGLDGVAVIVPRNSAVDALTLGQIREIFSGSATTWSAFGGGARPIHVYARDERSGTFDTFKSLVLDGAALAAGATRFEDSRALSSAVAADPDGIGFVGLAFVGDCRALKVGEAGATLYRPTVFTVRTEDYALARRLYLYTRGSEPDPTVTRFVNFALSNEGQAIVDAMGFVGQALTGASATQEARADGADVPPEYARLAQGAERLPLNFRFESGSDRLDNKAQRDVGRLLESLSQPDRRERQVLLFGFADGLGAPETNLRLSQSRADGVARELESEGIRAFVVRGFGSALPLATNATDEGRGRNRRVEVWLK